MNFRPIGNHTWAIDGETQSDMILVRFIPKVIESVSLTPDIESTLVKAYREHLERTNSLTPHLYTIRDEDIKYCLSGQAAFL